MAKPLNGNHSQISSLVSAALFSHDDDDDFQMPPTYPLSSTCPSSASSFKGCASRSRFNKKRKTTSPGKENLPPPEPSSGHTDILGLDSIRSTIIVNSTYSEEAPDNHLNATRVDSSISLSGKDASEGYAYRHNSIESKLLKSHSLNSNLGADAATSNFNDTNASEDLDALLGLCSEDDLGHSPQIESGESGAAALIHCPLCGVHISNLGLQERQLHTNECLDRGKPEFLHPPNVVLPNDKRESECLKETVDGSSLQLPRKVVDTSPVFKWLEGLGLAKYIEVFVREEIDWETLQWLTEEDLFNIGISALGPRKKIVHGLGELRKNRTQAAEAHFDIHSPDKLGKQRTCVEEIDSSAPKIKADETCRSMSNKLITDYFPGSAALRNKVYRNSRGPHGVDKNQNSSGGRCKVMKDKVKKGKLREVPSWCSIPGTPFRVDAFRYLRNDCSHWFLTHFHMDHYQGLTRSFCHGKIYCSSITAKLVNLKIGIPWDRLQVLPLNQKINLAGIDVTCLDANHCPGSIIILFEPPNGKAVLHTGDFRFSEEMAKTSLLQAGHIHTLILDTTYCNTQYDFPKQEAVIQFVIEAIEAEAFNPKTLFLIGSYTVGKERLFLEVARTLRKKVYVGLPKLRLLECFNYSEEDLQWFTVNEQESHIHVVPMWTLASFKRLKHISNQYMGRFSLIVAFSPTGWTFGKGKKKSPGRRWQQGTIIRYEVPYSEHSSFKELQEFVKLVSPADIIPSVNNDGPDSANAMVSLLLS